MNTYKKVKMDCLKKKIKFGISMALATLPILGCESGEKEITTEIVLTNNSDLELTDKAISIERSLFPKRDSLSQYPLLISAIDTIPSQLNDKDGDGEWDELFFVANFSAREKKELQLEWVNKLPRYPIRTSVRFGKREAIDEPVQPATEETLAATDMPKNLGFQKYQTDGPTWENNKVGFRHYLDGRNSKDVFGKRTASITPENVGINDKGEVEDNYHVMQDWGRDIFPVGNSTGLGGIALLVDGEVKRMGVTVNDTINIIEKTTFQIINEGPVKSVINLGYYNWKTSGNSYDVEETTAIWPGMYGFKNTIEVNNLQGNEALLVGLSNINNENPLKEIEVGEWVALIAHDYQTYDREWLLGTGILLPKTNYDGYMAAPEEGNLTDSYLAKINIENGTPISYFAIAGWELSANKNFKDPEYFEDYVINLAKQLSAKVDVEVIQENKS